MRSLKEKGWKPVLNDAIKIYNIYRRLCGWVATATTRHTNVCKFDLIQKGIPPSIFNILLSYFLFLLNVPVSFNFYVFICRASYKIFDNL